MAHKFQVEIFKEPDSADALKDTFICGVRWPAWGDKPAWGVRGEKAASIQDAAASAVSEVVKYFADELETA